MPADEFLVQPEAVDVDVPAGNATVTVRIIDTTTRIPAPPALILEQAPEGLQFPPAPSFSFLVSNGDRHILFDLGNRPDWENLSPVAAGFIKEYMPSLTASKHVADILDENVAQVGVSSKDIEAVILSHHHFDHVGDMTTFPNSTDLIVGPGFLGQYTPGYPTDPKSMLLDSDFADRNTRELDFGKESAGKKFGPFPAIDYFQDGSFYLLDAPGHTCGHLCGLARVSTSPDSFVLMGGDVAHYPGILKPTKWRPLPKNITPSPLPRYTGGCPGELLQKIHLKKSVDEPFFEASKAVPFNVDDNVQSIKQTQEVDGLDNVLVIIAHDEALGTELDLFPKTINDWYARDLDNKTRWAFCRHFAQLVENSEDSRP